MTSKNHGCEPARDRPLCTIGLKKRVIYIYIYVCVCVLDGLETQVHGLVVDSMSRSKNSCCQVTFREFTFIRAHKVFNRAQCWWCYRKKITSSSFLLWHAPAQSVRVSVLLSLFSYCRVDDTHGLHESIHTSG
jgi:hypothetical protein